MPLWSQGWQQRRRQVYRVVGGGPDGVGIMEGGRSGGSGALLVGRGDGAVQEVGVDGGVDAVGAAGVGGVAVAVVGEEVTGGELGGEGDGPGVGGGGVADGADDEDGGGAVGLDAF